MGRGRQKAKQQKIARKLKYLTTDTDYDELAKELSSQEVGSGSFDPFADVEEAEEARAAANRHASDSSSDAGAADAGATDAASGDAHAEDDLDEYAKWAAEAAAKATSGEMPAVKAVPKPHKPIPMPVPSALKPRKA